MNVKFKPSLILATLLTVTSIYSYAAEENAGVIHFTGEIIEPSCVIEGDDGTDSTVPLGTYPTSLFAKVGDESDLVPFTIKLASCPVASDGLAQVQLTFTGATSLTGSNTLLDVSQITTEGDPAATGVGIAVSPKDDSKSLLTFDGADGQVHIDLPSVADDIIETSFNARYKSFATDVKAGPADADMTVNILYR
ncbi:MAG TPA: fimbrial protein [Scandinavium sp.]|jgi:type 1 fimbrial protein|uniref:fimbrial protein n=1 Tax=Scandinavium sp. TaxID=2830653 RepID=UPI002E36954E|nr:fimbrial protein [Scandinavium sp.]HEX4502683.1 fimbrial protein [Scandinavium sp.]